MYIYVVDLTQLYYDTEWLGIVMEAQSYLSTSSLSVSIPDRFIISPETRAVLKEFEQQGKTNYSYSEQRSVVFQ